VLGYLKRIISSLKSNTQEVLVNNVKKVDLYKNIINDLSDGVYIVDKEKKITFWNNGASKLTGYIDLDVKIIQEYDSNI